MSALLLIYLIAVSVATLGMLRRNQLVFRYRMRIIDGLYQLGVKEIKSNKYSFDKSQQRQVEFQQVSYNEMVLKFWRPLDSFFDDKFLKKAGVK